MQALMNRLLIPAYALLAWGLALFTIYLCYLLEWRGPMRDLWEFVGLIKQQLRGEWDWPALLEPYGGIHRIFIPKLLFYLDYRFASGSNLISLSVTLCLHIMACTLLLLHIQKNPETNSQERTMLYALVVLFFFSTTQIYNLIYNSDNQVVLSNAFAIFSAGCFARQKMILSLLLLIAACLSHSSSLMLLPAFLLTALVFHQAPRQWFFLLVFSVVLAGFYVSGYDPLDDPATTMPLWQKSFSALLGVILQIDGILRYIGLYLTSPSSLSWPMGGIVMSYCSIVYLFSVAWRMYRKQWQLASYDKFFFILALYVFFIAVITACGRQMFPNSAFTDRYQTLVMTYWPALLILLYRDLKRVTPLSIGIIMGIIPLLSLLLLLPHQYSKAVEMSGLSNRVHIAHTAATVGITDLDTIAATLSHPLLINKKNLVEKHNEFLRKNELGYFSEPGAEYFLNPDQTARLDFSPEPSPDCSAQLVKTEMIEGSSNASNHWQYRLTGTARRDHQTVKNFLIVDREGHVVGLARTQRPKEEFLSFFSDEEDSLAWTGFMRVYSPLPLPLPLPLMLVDYQRKTSCELLQRSML